MDRASLLCSTRSGCGSKRKEVGKSAWEEERPFGCSEIRCEVGCGESNQRAAATAVSRPPPSVCSDLCVGRGASLHSAVSGVPAARQHSCQHPTSVMNSTQQAQVVRVRSDATPLSSPPTCCAAALRHTRTTLQPTRKKRAERRADTDDPLCRSMQTAYVSSSTRPLRLPSPAALSNAGSRRKGSAAASSPPSPSAAADCCLYPRPSPPLPTCSDSIHTSLLPCRCVAGWLQRRQSAALRPMRVKTPSEADGGR